MNHITLEMAKNQEVQEKLYRELVDRYPNDRVPYDDVNKNDYLNAVVDESMRLHPALNRVLRIAVDDCDLGRFRLKKGQMVGVSVYSLHRDPQYYGEDADKFRPERFLDGKVNADLIPFGQGPRMCIANRFALLELKSCLIRLIKRFRFSTNEHTMKFRYVNSVPVNQVDPNGLRMKIEKRTG